MKNLFLLAACAAPLALASCGGEDPPAAAVSKLSATEANPGAPTASSTIGRIAKTAETDTRLGLIDLTRDAALETPLPTGELRKLVLGDAGAKRASAATGAAVAVQVGGATLTEQAGGQGREVTGGSEQTQAALRETAPERNAGEDETAAAVQACLGDSIAQVITGPERLGQESAIGVGLAEAGDPPSGPHLRICVAPLRVKAVHDAEDRLMKLFPANGDPATRPVIGEQEIGEREIVSAKISLSRVSAAQLRGWLDGSEQVGALIGV